MFIQTEATPNPAVLKFLPGREVHGRRHPRVPRRERGPRLPAGRSTCSIWAA